MFQPDDLDRRLLKEMFTPASLQWNIRRSYATIAEKLGVDEETIRRRFQRMHVAGVFQNWQIIVNPHLIGFEAATFDLNFSSLDSRKRAISQLKLVQGIIYILLFYDNRIRIMTYYRNEDALKRQIELMETFCNCNHSMFWKDVFPPCAMKMSKTDWLVVAALLKKDPRKKLSIIASDSGISSKTLNRRMQRMNEGHAFFLDAAIDVRKLGGSPCAILVEYYNSAKKRLADDLILKTIGNITMSNTSPDMHSMFSIHCENMADAKRVSEWIESLDGVKEARMGIYEEKIAVSDWLSEEIEMRARK